MVKRWLTRDPEHPGEARGQAYDDLMARARRALDEEPGLAPSAWVRVRAGAEQPRRRSAGGLWLPVGAVALLALAWVAVPSATHEDPPAVTAVGPDAEPTASGEVLLPEGQVMAAHGSPRALHFGGGHVVTLHPDATIRVEASTPRMTRLRLLSGRLRADVVPLEVGDGFEVVTVEATVRVVGTRFSVHRDPAVGTRVVVEEGRVLLLAGTRSTVLGTGEEATEPPSPTLAPVAGTSPAEVVPTTALHRPARSVRSERSDEGAAAGDRFIDIRVPDASMAPREPRKGRGDLMRAALRRIETEGCSSGRPALLEVLERHGPGADAWYLLGYCAHRMGHADMAEAYFERYRRAAPNGILPVPSSAGAPLPLPSAAAVGIR